MTLSGIIYWNFSLLGTGRLDNSDMRYGQTHCKCDPNDVIFLLFISSIRRINGQEWEEKIGECGFRLSAMSECYAKGAVHSRWRKLVSQLKVDECLLFIITVCFVCICFGRGISYPMFNMGTVHVNTIPFDLLVGLPGVCCFLFFRTKHIGLRTSKTRRHEWWIFIRFVHRSSLQKMTSIFHWNY